VRICVVCVNVSCTCLRLQWCEGVLIISFHFVGQQYDKNGNRVKWWTDSSIAAFKNRTQCFVDQYNKYEQQGVKVCILSVVYANALHVAVLDQWKTYTW